MATRRKKMTPFGRRRWRLPVMLVVEAADLDEARRGYKAFFDGLRLGTLEVRDQYGHIVTPPPARLVGWSHGGDIREVEVE